MSLIADKKKKRALKFLNITHIHRHDVGGDVSDEELDRKMRLTDFFKQLHSSLAAMMRNNFFLTVHVCECV